MPQRLPGHVANPHCDLSIMVLLLVAFIGMQLAFGAAAWALGITPDVMRTGVETFFNE